MFSFILTLLGIVIFTTYISVLLWFYKKEEGGIIPPSLSDSFYIYDRKKKGLGYIFTGMMFVIALILMMGWLELNDGFNDWRSNFTFLPFFCCASIAFVGAAPAFRSSELEGNVHTIAAKIAAATAIIWVIIQNSSVNDWYWLVLSIVLGVGVPIAVGLGTKTMKSAQVFHLEMMAFISVFISAFIHCLMNII